MAKTVGLGVVKKVEKDKEIKNLKKENARLIAENEALKAELEALKKAE